MFLWNGDTPMCFFFLPENSLERVIQQALQYITVPPNNLILSNINIVNIVMMFVMFFFCPPPPRGDIMITPQTFPIRASICLQSYEASLMILCVFV